MRGKREEMQTINTKLIKPFIAMGKWGQRME